jgi:hypothetical protein
MPTTPETRIRKRVAKIARTQITQRSRSSAGFAVTYPVAAWQKGSGLTEVCESTHETVNVPTKKEALSLLLVKARICSELVFKIVPRRAPSKAAKWCDACQMKHPVPQTIEEYTELLCLKPWKEKKA